MDDIVLGVGFAVVVGPPAILLALGLSTVNDAFKIREELIGTIIGGLCSQGMPASPDTHLVICSDKRYIREHSVSPYP